MVSAARGNARWRRSGRRRRWCRTTVRGVCRSRCGGSLVGWPRSVRRRRRSARWRRARPGTGHRRAVAQMGVARAFKLGGVLLRLEQRARIARLDRLRLAGPECRRNRAALSGILLLITFAPGSISPRRTFGKSAKPAIRANSPMASWFCGVMCPGAVKRMGLPVTGT